MNRTPVAVVLAGGTGRRLFPASRPERPKQFLSLGSENSLLAETLDRASITDQQYVLTRPAYTETVREHAPDVPVLTEPMAKDTGPALVYAAHRISEQVENPVLLCLPSDHAVSGSFGPVARRAVQTAVETGRLVTVGIEPDRPATGYGYIEPGDADTGQEHVHPVERFVEKPDRESAREYVEAGWYWNSGIFAWTPQALLEEARDSRLAPLVRELENGNPQAGFERVESVSIDRAVLEETPQLSVVAGQFTWDDLGSWDGVGRALDGDETDTVSLGECYTVDTERCILATDGTLGAVGVEDIVVATFEGKTVVLPRGETERIQELLDELA